jgi:hypothetical protein
MILRSQVLVIISQIACGEKIKVFLLFCYHSFIEVFSILRLGISIFTNRVKQLILII